MHACTRTHACTHAHMHTHTHCTHTHEVGEAISDFEGANPVCGADKRWSLFTHLYQGLLDLTVGRRRPVCVALEHKP